MRALALIFVMVCSLFTIGLQVPPDQEDHRLAEELWPLIQGYEDWDLVPRTSRMMPGQAPHGRYVTIYANEVASRTLDTDAATMPPGAIFAKSNFSSQRTLENITVMYRQNDTWQWVVYEPDGSIQRAGNLQDCLACHSGAQRDRVFSWQQSE